MPEETQEAQMDVNPAPEASAEATQEVAAQPPAESNPAAEQPAKEEKYVPYSRFKEIIDSKNETAKELASLRAQMSTLDQRTKPQEPSLLDKTVNRLKSKGLEEEAAKELAGTMIDLANEVAGAKVKPVEELTAQQEIKGWMKDFASKNNDFEQLVPEMSKVYEAFPEKTQEMLASDPIAVELIYSHVKRQKLEEQLKSKFKEGVQTAYDNKLTKEGISSSPTVAATPSTLTPEMIAAMTTEEFKKREAEVDKLYKLGLG